MFTTSYFGFPRRPDDNTRRGSFLGMNHLQLTDRGSIQLVDEVERFHCINSETFVSGRRVKIRIRGELFETFEETLMRFPDTLLGSRRKRREHFVSAKDAYVFDERDKFAFNAILFFYQSGGILARPSDVPFTTFARELEFFELTDYFPDCWTLKTVSVDREIPETAWCKTLWLLFEDPKSSWGAWLVSWITFVFIVVTTGLLCFETTVIGHTLLCEANNGTVPLDRAVYCEETIAWFALDSIATTWFVFEYFARLLTTPRKLNFVFSFLGMIDLLALVPYFGILIPKLQNGRWPHDHNGIEPLLRVLRLVRVMRVLKLAHHIEALRLLGYTIRQCMYLIVGLILLVTILTISLSSSIYLAEKSSPTSKINNTPEAAWFVIITLTNVGYGDVVPTTILGKVLGGIAAVLGILVVFILPAPVLLNHFEEIYNLRKERRKRNKSTMKCNSFSGKLCD